MALFISLAFLTGASSVGMAADMISNTATNGTVSKDAGKDVGSSSTVKPKTHSKKKTKTTKTKKTKTTKKTNTKKKKKKSTSADTSKSAGN